MKTPLSDEFGLDLALFAFNYQPDVVIEVCKVGGMGVLGAVRFTPKFRANSSTTGMPAPRASSSVTTSAGSGRAMR